MTTVTVGPEQGSLTLHTGVEGRAAKAGHALTILIRDWSGTATFDGADPTGLSLRAALASLEVVSGEGGLKPLSDKDKRTIQSTALEVLGAARHPEVTFVSSSVTPGPHGYDLGGEVVLAGVARSCTLQLQVQRAEGVATVEARVPITQTQFGLKPYTGLMGGLRVRDQVDIALSVTVEVPV